MRLTSFAASAWQNESSLMRSPARFAALAKYRIRKANGTLRAPVHSMLQIDIEERAGLAPLLTVKGELSGTSALELVARWNQLREILAGKVCVVDLSHVLAMDEAGRETISAIAHDGAHFLASGPMLGHVIDLVCRASVRASHEGIPGFRSMVFNSTYQCP
jgi:hypothetical protein